MSDLVVAQGDLQHAQVAIRDYTAEVLLGFECGRRRPWQQRLSVFSRKLPQLPTVRFTRNLIRVPHGGLLLVCPQPKLWGQLRGQRH